MTFIQPPVQPPTPPTTFPATDYGCARMLAWHYADQLRYCQDWGCFLVYEDGKWVKENRRQSAKWATDIAVQQQISQGVNTLTRADFIKKILYHAQNIMTITPEELDLHTGILNFRNGTLHLTSGDLLPHDPNHFITQQIPYDWTPGVSCPLWESHLNTMCKGDKELIDLIQILAGITLWGGVDREQVFVHLRGAGRNGKGVFMRIFTKALGDYALAAPLNLLTLAEGAHSTEYTTLRGKRFVSCSEMGTKKLNLGTLKVLTGGDEVTARSMRKDATTFNNTWLIWIATNYSLNTTGDAGDALWERYVPIHLGDMIPADQRKNSIEDDLEFEVKNSAIINWAVEGCLKWRKAGRLHLPDRVQEWRSNERDSSDVFGTYVEERLEFHPNASILLSAIAGDYAMWAAMNGEFLKMTSKNIASDLRTRYNVEVRPGAKHKRYAYGVTVRSG